MIEQSLLDFLGHLEQLEARLLSWGLVDGSFSRSELARLADRFLSEQDLWGEVKDEDDFIRRLVDERLLYSFIDGSDECYRTRTAETVRLLSRLRQLFPKHLEGRRWQTAPTLVGDFRFVLRRREFPRRSLTAEDVSSRLKSIRAFDNLQMAVLQGLLGTGKSAEYLLAGFQLRAAESILRGAGTARGSATIVCAGTGSGKTLAFYLPTLLHLAPTLDENRWTRCLAIYPRNELLKDQLSETYRQARRLDSIFKQHGKRRLVIGTLFGATPDNERVFEFDTPPRDWQRVGDDFICPFLRCPNGDCAGDLIWRTTNRRAGKQDLHCQTCGVQVDHENLVLTRERLQSEPPDILFTTTEMMNQRMGDSRFCHLFGVATDRRQKPQVVLLDEVHTYSGVSGAQIALLLRRWKHAAAARPHFVGLSATLADARRFFATLVGVEDFLVDEVAPQRGELERRGMEYLLAVRSDPASRTSVLSTTIQTAMLMRRVLEPPSGTVNSAVFGRRGFIFTDDLDVTNRLFFNLRDAEGQDSWGRPDPRRPDGSLANLRSQQHPEPGLRYRLGQNWHLCEWIGHRLDARTSLRIGRTSSQDAGVVSGADLIVATASLEVGFNDPDVNVILQHKAPKDPAQFLQRKGRAGRRTSMRPWTIVVLSDYGRDRLAWQGYDILFDPELAPRDLPVANHHVLRMQAVFAFFDWIAAQLRRVPGLPKGSVWRDFSGPSSKLGSRYCQVARPRQLAAARIIEGILYRDEGLDDLVKYLGHALDQSDESVTSLLWEPPRALLTAALPTLLRRLETDWRHVAAERHKFDYHIVNNPLPEFVPAQLFGDLNLPEVTILTPPQQRGDEEREEFLPLHRAMHEFAPGRVSRRFGIKNIYARHWIAPRSLSNEPTQEVAVGSICSRYEELGSFQYRATASGTPVPIRCVRPLEYRVTVPPKNILDSSNAFLNWHTQIGPDGDGLAVDLPIDSRWEDVVHEIRFFTHVHRSPLEMRRFATSSDATISFEKGVELEMRLLFVEHVGDGDAESHESVPVGMGFSFEVDGLVVRHRIPDDFVARVAADTITLRSLRTARYQDKVVDDRNLDGIANSFQRRWLAQVFVSALTHAAATHRVSLESVLGDERGLVRLDLLGVLSVIFQSIPVSVSDDDEPDRDAFDDVQQRLQQDLTKLLSDAAVLDALRRHAPVLWEPVDDRWRPWLERKYCATLGSAFLDAIQKSCPDLDAAELTLDIDSGPRPPGTTRAPDDLLELWITEQTVGGGGIVEKFLIRYAEDPRRFFGLVEAALEPSDFEIADEQLATFLVWANDPVDDEIRNELASVRTARTVSCDEYTESFDRFRGLLMRRGLFVCHPVLVALGTRVLRPGSTAATDRLLHELVARWRNLESELGLEIDSRVFAFLQCDNDELDRAIDEMGGDDCIDRRQWRFGAIYGLLWPRGRSARGRALSVYNPFAELPETDRDLVRMSLGPEPEAISVTQPDWRERVEERLIADGSAVLDASIADLDRMRRAIIDLFTAPIDTGFLLVHPRMRGLDRRSGHLCATLELAERYQ